MRHQSHIKAWWSTLKSFFTIKIINIIAFLSKQESHHRCMWKRMSYVKKMKDQIEHKKIAIITCCCWLLLVTIGTYFHVALTTIFFFFSNSLVPLATKSLVMFMRKKQKVSKLFVASWTQRARKCIAWITLPRWFVSTSLVMLLRYYVVRSIVPPIVIIYFLTMLLFRLPGQRFLQRRCIYSFFCFFFFWFLENVGGSEKASKNK